MRVVTIAAIGLLVSALSGCAVYPYRDGGVVVAPMPEVVYVYPQVEYRVIERYEPGRYQQRRYHEECREHGRHCRH